MQQLLQSLKTIFDRITAFFDPFDVSFFISGAICVSAVVTFAAMQTEGTPHQRDLIGSLTNIETHTGIILVLGCYIAGIFCMALGRTLRWFGEKLVWILYKKMYHVEASKQPNPFTHYGSLNEGMAQLKLFSSDLDYLDTEDHNNKERLVHIYNRFWAELRGNSDLAESYLFLKRYWVFTSVCDGVSAAFFVWGALLISVWIWAVFGFLFVLFFTGLAIHYTRYQSHELAASIAYSIDKTKQKKSALPKNDEE